MADVPGRCCSSLAYFGDVRFGDSDQCDWLIIEDYGPLARLVAPQETSWRYVWQGSRRRDPDERFRLYRRARR